MKALKAFIKPFVAPQGIVKIKIYVDFILIKLSKMHATGRVKTSFWVFYANCHDCIPWDWMYIIRETKRLGYTATKIKKHKKSRKFKNGD